MINIKIDSRKVQKGDIFVAIKGHTVDGHDYIDKAIENGASKIICEKDIDVSVPYEKVNNSEEWLKDYLVKNYSKEINEMNLLGVTGTNGKTTTAYLTYQMLNMLGSKTGYIGTIGFYLPDEDFIEIDNTTPNILDLYELLVTAKSKGCINVMMEVSSHALSYERVAGLNFKVGAFTNLTEDHLDYHKTMENYLQAKLLFLNYLEGPIIINMDDSYASRWVEKASKYITLGKNGKDYQIIGFEDNLDGTIINLKYQGKDYTVKNHLKSHFNVYNYLTSVAIIHELGYSLEDIFKISEDVKPPKGRCEQIKVKGGIAVVDYAHTPDAVEKIIDAFLLNKKGKIITLVGCGGDRDPKKRPIMGNIASEKSDYVIFTSDNPRTEDPKLIMEDILKGVTKDNYEVILDRPTAIRKGLELINDNDVFLILGKGHEDYQIIGHTKIHLDDMEEVQKYIDSLK